MSSRLSTNDPQRSPFLSTRHRRSWKPKSPSHSRYNLATSRVVLAEHQACRTPLEHCPGSELQATVQKRRATRETANSDIFSANA